MTNVGCHVEDDVARVWDGGQTLVTHYVASPNP
jgi:hypothetical protein